MEAVKPVSIWKRVGRSSALAVGLIVVLFGGFVVFFEDSFIYFPARDGVGPSPGEDVAIACPDGVKIHGWFLSHPEAKVSLLFFHGNAGNIEDRRDVILALRGLKANVLAIDYRGYGKSEGKPSEPGLYLDARAAYDWLRAKVPPAKLVVFGKSLGGGPACELAATVPVDGLIVQSAFTSAPDMSSRVIPLLPARWFMRTKFDNLAKVRKATCPKLFIHSRADEIIPFEMAERLFAEAAGPKECEWYDGADHNGLIDQNEAKYYPRLGEFLRKVAP